MFDLLLKPYLSKRDIERIKKVATTLLKTLMAERLRIENWRENEATRDAVHIAIRDYLWNDDIGLPSPAYTEDEVADKTDAVYRHVYRVYPAIPSPIYGL